MAPHYQAASLASSPRYANSVAWSSDNLIAVSCGHIITILNPDSLGSPRGLIILHPSDPFPIGAVNKEDVFKPCLMPTSLSRDARPCARSISWSQLGFAPDFGCLLAVCTTDGCVKLYRSPILEFQDEWIEVINISSLLYAYMETIRFGESDEPISDHEHNTVDQEKPVSLKTYARKTRKATSMRDSPTNGNICRSRKRKPVRLEGFVYKENSDDTLPTSKKSNSEFALVRHSIDNNGSASTNDPNLLKPIINVSDAACDDWLLTKQQSAVPIAVENKTAKLISAKQYASRIATLSSLVVAWSPIIPSSERGLCILAVGSKAGQISLWKICMPQFYDIHRSTLSLDPCLVGLLQAHSSWVTAITWGASGSNLNLVSGSSDGSVKIWLVHVEKLASRLQAEGLCSLSCEITPVSPAAVCTMSLVVPVPSQDLSVLAVGRGSGALDVWIYTGGKVRSAGGYDAHGQTVTGLAWSCDGHLLYSCSQDNSLYCWIFKEDHLEEVPFTSKFPGLKSSADLSALTDQCFGLALASGELIVAVVRTFDSNVLNQMYEARIQKAVIEFFWTGVVASLENVIRRVGKPDLHGNEFHCWQPIIVSSLKKLEDENNGLCIWDTLTALLIFKKLDPVLFNNVLAEWISAWFFDNEVGELTQVLLQVKNVVETLSSRRLHLLNVICRKLFLHSVKSSEANILAISGTQNRISDVHTDVWTEFLIASERKLRERLIKLTLSTVVNSLSDSSVNRSADATWFPVGVAQMENWISKMRRDLCSDLRALQLQIKELGSRVYSACEYITDEKCGYCAAPVHFNSVDEDWCQGSIDSHRLVRCAVSMKLCSIEAPVWHCLCCKRVVENLAPSTFFSSPSGDPQKNELLPDSHLPLVPFCPFCGILLQSPKPEFLLSKAPV